MSTQIVFRGTEVYAFNTAGIGYDHKVEKRFEGYILHARSVSNLFLKHGDNNHTTTTLLYPSPGELGTQGTSCLWIGMSPTIANDFTYAALKKSKAPNLPKKGQPISEGQSQSIIPHEPNALRVVVVMSHSQNKYFALVQEKQGLPEARRVEQDVVFFFSTFRDDRVAAREKRGEIWSKKIKDFKIQAGQQVPQARGRSATQVAIQAKINFTNQLQGLVATYLRDPREHYLKAMKEVVQKEDQDLQHRPLGSEAIMNLVDSKKEVTLLVAETAIREMTTIWTALGELEIKPEEIVFLSKGLAESGIVLEYSLIRVFVVDWLRTLRGKGVQEDQSGDVAREIHHFARLSCGGGVTRPRLLVKDNDFLAFLDTTIENLRSLEIYGCDYVDAVTESLGHDYSGDGLAEIFRRFAITPDIESAQQWIREACRYLVTEMSHRDQGVLKYLKDLIENLEEIRVNISDRQDTDM